jgi:class 3 adenylate cyclase
VNSSLVNRESGRSSGPGEAEGERKFVTVMFADLARSSRFVIGQDPEDADERLLAILQLMIDSVHRFGGTVNQVLGDGIMALFGVPRFTPWWLSLPAKWAPAARAPAPWSGSG